jgi:four helix bundle protein
MFGFEKLDVWQKAIELSHHVYAMTRTFPTDERFGLTSQMRRAAVSVASNIAEGSGRGSNPDFGRFVEIAYGSLMELITQAKIATGQAFLLQPDFDKLYRQSEEIARMLSGLRNSLVSGSNR